jgi:hypothetical protein
VSRARGRSTIYVVADNVEQAGEDLVRKWSAERRPAWVIDSGTPVTDPAAVEAACGGRAHARGPAPGTPDCRTSGDRRRHPARPVCRNPRRRTAASAHQRRAGGPGCGHGPLPSGPIADALGELRQAEMNVDRLASQREPPGGVSEGPAPPAGRAGRMAGAPCCLSRGAEFDDRPRSRPVSTPTRPVDGATRGAGKQQAEPRAGSLLIRRPPGASTT